MEGDGGKEGGREGGKEGGGTEVCGVPKGTNLGDLQYLMVNISLGGRGG